LKIVYFTHSLVSCWNHGNAHFLRGLLRELVARGHDVRALEPDDSWSRKNLEAVRGQHTFARFGARFPDLANVVAAYDSPSDLAPALDDADLVIVHEWTAPEIVTAVGEMRRRGAAFTLLFHDTHHRSVSDPQAIRRLDLTGYDGVLAFGQSLADVYKRAGWGNRVFVFHEAADVRLFMPPDGACDASRSGAVWIGNWGDGERTEELGAFLLRPARDAHIALDVHGVRYPADAIEALHGHGARYRGWIANDSVPKAFARHLFTVHVPRRYYAQMLPGIPTIRVFEALACGLPLVSAPWDDAENLFRPGRDFLVTPTEEAMAAAMRAVANDEDMRRELAASGLETIRNRHTCAHRADALLAIAAQLRPRLKGAA
jgi:spore maturation protein CgeB